jgi:hypothetical protein
MPSDLANVVLAPFLAQFALDFSAISLEIDLSARFVDLIGENFDLAIRMGDLRDDASLAARKIAMFSVSLYASPSYLARRGTPSEPEALMEHDALRVLARDGDAMPWVLARGEQRWEGIPSRPSDCEFTGAADANGVGWRGDYDRQRPLRHALPAARRARPGAARLAPAAGRRMGGVPGRRLMPARTRVFLDALAAKFSGPECREIEAKVEAAKTRSRRGKRDRGQRMIRRTRRPPRYRSMMKPPIIPPRWAKCATPDCEPETPRKSSSAA